MQRQTWVQDPVTLELIPKDEYHSRAPSGPFVMGELAPYRSMITGEMIDGRRSHREHLKQHGCIEVGNEKLKPRTERPIPREDIRRDLHQVFSGKGF